MVSGYRDLIFYQKAQEVVRGIDLLIKTWPQSLQVQEISRQLFRSAISVGANIAEGHGRHQGREYIHYLTILKDQPTRLFAGFIQPWIVI
jgi:four helix bundle protein